MKAHFLPKTDGELSLWLQNFASKLPSYQTILNLSAEDLSSAARDAETLSYSLKISEAYRNEWKERTSFKKILKEGNGAAITLPTPPVEPPAPQGTIISGIVPRIRKFSQRIKKHPNFTTSIGIDLGLIGTDVNRDASALQPEIKAVFSGGEVVIAWKKGVSDGIDIYVDRGTGWEFLATDFQPNFTDKYRLSAEAAAAKWKYKARYRIGDEQAGNWSNVVEVAVLSSAV